MDILNRVARQVGPTLDMVNIAPNEMARRAGVPVARIVTGGKDHIEVRGRATGFLVSPHLLLTNYHVFQTLTKAGAPYDTYRDSEAFRRQP